MKKTQKTRRGFEWYRLLTKKQQKQFRRNLMNHVRNKDFSWLQYLHFILNTNSNPYTFIFGAFNAYETKEGSQYWQTIFIKLINK